MRKLIVLIALLLTVTVLADPYVNVIVDDGIAGVTARTSVHHKFESVFVWRW
jgi:hypothetical protein